MNDEALPAGVILLRRDAGRRYALGTMTGVFKADGAETRDTYSISEWWLEPHSAGPGPHQHEANDDLFYVIEGTMSFLAGTQRLVAGPGDFLRIPAGVMHDFWNESDARAGVFNVFIPGGFERDMPAIEQWFRDQAGKPD